MAAATLEAQLNDFIKFKYPENKRSYMPCMPFRKRKSQAAMEYLMVAGLVALIILPSTFLFYRYAFDASRQIDEAQVEKLGRDIINTAETVAAFGPSSRIVLTEYLPSNVESISAEQTPEGKSLLKISVRSLKGVSEFTYPTEVDMRGALTGDAISQGNKKIVLQSVQSETDSTKSFVQFYYSQPMCSDGTPYNGCSAAKPKRCQEGTLVDDCGLCGCDSGTCITGLGICFNLGSLSVQLQAPASDVELGQKEQFVLTATASCTGIEGAGCGTVSMVAMQEDDGQANKQIVPETGTPFTTPSNIKSCGNLDAGQACQKSWSITATGDVNDYKHFYVNASSAQPFSLAAETSRIKAIITTGCFTGYADSDGDGYTPSTPQEFCGVTELPAGYKSAQSAITDCDDSNAAKWRLRYPGTTTSCQKPQQVCVGNEPGYSDSAPPFMAFATSTTYKGDFGGVNSADSICNAKAKAAGLPGTYTAWVSSGAATEPRDRGLGECAAAGANSVGWKLATGTKIADNWADLTDGIIAAPINVNEKGQVVTTASAWTCTSSNGAHANCDALIQALYTNDCKDWTDRNSWQPGIAGSTSRTNAFWSYNEFESFSCSQQYAIYCFQSSTAQCKDADGDGYGNPGDATCKGGPATDCNDAASSCTTDCSDTDNDGAADCLDLCNDKDKDNYGNDMTSVVVGGGSIPVGSCTTNGATPCTFGDAACLGTDCNENCATCYAGSTSYTALPDSLNQDCDSQTDENDAQPTKQCNTVSGDSTTLFKKSDMEAVCDSYCGAPRINLACGSVTTTSANYRRSLNFNTCTATGDVFSGTVTACKVTSDPADYIRCECPKAYR